MAQRISDRLGRPAWSGYDVAQICANGHLVNCVTVANPAHSQPFCQQCGAASTTTCKSCGKPIRGYHHNQRVVRSYEVPAFCGECGKPFPWTADRILSAKVLVDEIAELDENERLLLKASIDDIVQDTPKTQVAVVRFKRFVAKASTETRSALRAILYEIAAEAAKVGIWGP